jgi:hypothetical protein
MITIATDSETKDRIRRYAEAAGVDLTTYISAAISSAMLRDDQVSRTFAPLDALIDEAEERDGELPWPPPTADSSPEPKDISPAENTSIDRALDEFFDNPHGRRGIA